MMQTQIFLYSDDIATIQPNLTEECEVVGFDMSGCAEEDDNDMNSHLDDDLNDATCNSNNNVNGVSNSCDDFDSLLSESDTESLSENEDGEDDDVDKDGMDLQPNMDHLGSTLSSIRKVDMELSIRGFIILCLYSMFHGAFYNCFATVLEAVGPHLIFSQNSMLLLVALTISSLTGAFHWYLDFMDDADEDISKRWTKFQREKRRLHSLLTNRKQSMSESLLISSNKFLSMRLYIFEMKYKATRKLKKIPAIQVFLDLVAFYCIYTSTSNVAYTSFVPIIQTPKIDVINQLPSSHLNVTEGYHPSLLMRYLTQGVRIEELKKNNVDVWETNETFAVDEALIRMLQETLNHSKSNEAIGECLLDDSSGEIVDGHNQCQASKNVLVDDDWNIASSTDSQMSLSSHFLAFQKLEGRWTEEDYVFFTKITSPSSVVELFGNYETMLVKCSHYFLLYAFVMGVTLVLLALVGVPAINIFE